MFVHALSFLSPLGWRPAHVLYVVLSRNLFTLALTDFQDRTQIEEVYYLSVCVCVCVYWVLGVQCLSCWWTIIELLLHRCAAWGDQNTVINRNPYPHCVCFATLHDFICAVRQCFQTVSLQTKTPPVDSRYLSYRRGRCEATPRHYISTFDNQINSA